MPWRQGGSVPEEEAIPGLLVRLPFTTTHTHSSLHSMSFKQEIDMKEDTQQFEDVAVHEHETGIDPAKERALLRKLDLRIILPLFFCYVS